MAMDFFNDTNTFKLQVLREHSTQLEHFPGSSDTPTLLSSFYVPSGYSLFPRIIAILFCFILLRYTYLLLVRQHFSPNRHLPSPVQGWALFRLLHEPNVKELEHWMDTVPHNGLIRYFGLWNEERIFAASPAAVKDLLIKQPYSYVKPRLQYVLANNIASQGLLILEGDVHRAARRAFNPAFNPERLRKSYPTMLSSASELLDKIAEQIEAGHCKAAGQASILKLVSAAATDIIGHWGFSHSFNALQDPKGFSKAYIEMFKTTKRGQMTLDAAAKIGPELALRLPLRAVKTINRVMTLVRQTSDELVSNHEHDHEHEHAQSSEESDMLTTIMQTNHFTHTELVNQTVHFLAAATETVSGSVSWTIHLLSRHPEIQSKLREEIHRNFPSRPKTFPNHHPHHHHPHHHHPHHHHHHHQDTNSLASTLSATKMPYLNAVIKEVLRFHSVNTILWRQAISPTSTLCNHPIPLGTKITFSPWTLNRDPAHWGPDARVFDPQRWISDPVSGGADHTYSFLTFGAGPRRCIGEEYAKIEMRCLVLALVGGFEWRPVDELMGERGSDEGEEIGHNHALTLFKILEGWRVRCERVSGW